MRKHNSDCNGKIYFALLVFIVLCSSDGLLVFPDPLLSSLLQLSTVSLAPELTLLLFAPLPLKEVVAWTVEGVVTLGGVLFEVCAYTRV